MDISKLVFGYIKGFYKDEDEHTKELARLISDFEAMKSLKTKQGYSLHDHQIMDRPDWSELVDLHGKKSSEEKMGSIAIYYCFKPIDIDDDNVLKKGINRILNIFRPEEK